MDKYRCLICDYIYDPAAGDPENGVHAVQLELSEITYMDEDPPFAFRDDLAEKVRPVLSGLIHTMLAWAEMELQG